MVEDHILALIAFPSHSETYSLTPFLIIIVILGMPSKINGKEVVI